MSPRRRWIASVVDLPGMKPNWSSEISTTSCNLLSITLSHSFIVWLSSLMPLKLSQTWISPLFLYSGMTVLALHELSIGHSAKIIYKKKSNHTWFLYKHGTKQKRGARNTSKRRVGPWSENKKRKAGTSRPKFFPDLSPFLLFSDFFTFSNLTL